MGRRRADRRPDVASASPGPAAALGRFQRDHRGCVRCVEAGLLPAAHPVVSGTAGQRVMLVGQAPGPVEDAAGRPWSGRAGRQLMRWMRRAGFAGEGDVRARVFMTSATSCFPGRRTDGSGDRRPTPRELALCAPWLDGYLAIVRPRLVIAVGSLAVARLLGPRPLDALVGRVLRLDGTPWEPSRSGDGAQPLLIVLPHPSGQSRWLNDPGRRELLDAALRRVGELVLRAEAT